MFISVIYLGCKFVVCAGLNTSFVYGWKMEVEVVMTPYEEVYKKIQETK
jgi:hypothetical protein